jgi:hypothetical protein
VRFVGYTPTLRTFVNKIRNSGRPLAVTTIDVGTTTKEIEKLLGPDSAPPRRPAAGAAPAVVGTPTLSFFDQARRRGANGPAAAASAEDKRVLVVPRNFPPSSCRWITFPSPRRSRRPLPKANLRSKASRT